MKIKKGYVFIFLSLIFGLVVFYLALQKVGWREVWHSFNILSWWQFIIVVLVALIGFIFAALRWRIIMNAHQKGDYPLFKIFKARVIGYALSYLTPSAYIGGEPLRAIVIKEETGLDFKNGISSVIIDKVLELTIDVLFIIIGVIYLFIYFNLPDWLNWLLISLLAVCLILSFFFYSRTFRKKGLLSKLLKLFGFVKNKKIDEITNHIEDVEDAISDFFVHQRVCLTYAVIYSFISRFFTILAFWFIIFFLGAEVSLFKLLGFFALTAAVYFIPIPGALGIHEMSQAVIFGIFKLGSSTGIAFSLIWRAACLISVAIGLLFLLIFQLRVWGSKAAGTIGKICDKICDLF